MDTEKETTGDVATAEASNTALDESITFDNDAALIEKPSISDVVSVSTLEIKTDKISHEVTAAVTDNVDKVSTIINVDVDLLTVCDDDITHSLSTDEVTANEYSTDNNKITVELSTASDDVDKIPTTIDDATKLPTVNNDAIVEFSSTNEIVTVETSIPTNNVTGEISATGENNNKTVKDPIDDIDTNKLTINDSICQSPVNVDVAVESSVIGTTCDSGIEIPIADTISDIDSSTTTQVHNKQENIRSVEQVKNVDVSKIDQPIIMADGSPILLESSTLTLPDDSEGIFLIQTTDSGVTETHVIARVPEDTDITSTEYVYATTDVLTKLCARDTLIESSEKSAIQTDSCIGIDVKNKSVESVPKSKQSKKNTVKIDISTPMENTDVSSDETDQWTEENNQTDKMGVSARKMTPDLKKEKENTISQDTEKNTDEKLNIIIEEEKTTEKISNGKMNITDDTNNQNVKRLVSDALKTSFEGHQLKMKAKQINEMKKESKVVNSIPNIAETIVSDWTFDDHYENDDNSRTIDKTPNTSDSYEVEIVVRLDDTDDSGPEKSVNIVEVKETNVDIVTFPFVVSENKTPSNRVDVNDSSYKRDVFPPRSQKKLTLDDITKEIQETEQKENEREKSINNNDNTISLKEVVLNESQTFEILTDLTVIDPEVHRSGDNSVPMTLISINENYEIEESDAVDKHRLAVAKESSSSGSKTARPSTSDGVPIPCHLMGRTLENPQEDLVCNGRTPPKPRLGVKVPYRYLTSQICSKDEIAQEIIAKNTVEQPDVPNTGDVFFVKKLFQNLAKKILSSEERKNLESSPNEDNSKINDKEEDEEMSSTSLTTVVKKTQEKGIAERLRSLDGGNMKNAKKSAIDRKSVKGTLKKEKKSTVTDQELLAILEGNVNIKMTDLQRKEDGSPPVLTPEDTMISQNMSISDTPPKLEPAGIAKSNSNDAIAAPIDLDSETIRRLALKQLSELPCGKRAKKEQPIVIKRPRGRPRKHPKPPKKPVENFIVDPNDPFAFDENSRPSELPKYEPLVPPRVIKTYGKKTDKDEIEPENIIIPKEILDIEIQTCESETVTEETDKSVVLKSVGGEVNILVDEVRTDQVEFNDKTEIEKKEKKTVNPKNEKFIKGNKIIVRKENISDRPLVLTSKRARVIKRKVIWDPDEAQPVRTILQKKTAKKHDTDETARTVETRDIVRRPTAKRPLLSRESFKNAKRKLLKRLHGRKFVKKFAISKGSRVSVLAANLSSKKKPKKMSEIDRLLMDEGALNMLYSIERDGDTPTIKDRQRVISIDKFEREMNKKKRAVMTVLSTTPDASPKILRKKESPSGSVTSNTVPLRKKSRDSVHGSVHTPPRSPGLMFPPRAEASRIIRRHSSSSSFSSGCTSPRRLSTTDLERKTVSNESELKSDSNENDIEQHSESSNEKRRGTTINVSRSERKTLSGKKKNTVSDENEVIVTDGSEDGNMRKSSGRQTILKEKTLTRKRKLLDSSVFSEEKKSKMLKTVEKEIVAESGDDIELQVQIIVEGDVQKNKAGSSKQKIEQQSIQSKEYNEISLRSFDWLVQIILTPTVTKGGNFLSIQALQELSQALNILGNSQSCRTVLLTSTGNIFCKGIDYSFLIRSNLDERKKAATEMINSIRELVRAVAGFPYPLVAGVQGATSGLGVALLPLCDLVLVSDRATFSMPYAKLGCIPEAAATTTLSQVTSLAVTSELLLAGHTITAAEALRHGLASRVLWPDNFQKELISICNGIAAQSVQSMTAMKKLLRHSLLSKVDLAMESECDLIIEQWISEECQHNFKNAVNQNDW